ncbi:hypothetical protein S2E19_03197 [Bacillus mycoides]|nr:hypothetical protein S2E19_03197 [Bacillus mycoides]
MRTSSLQKEYQRKNVQNFNLIKTIQFAKRKGWIVVVATEMLL